MYSDMPLTVWLTLKKVTIRDVSLLIGRWTKWWICTKSTPRCLNHIQFGLRINPKKCSKDLFFNGGWLLDAYFRQLTQMLVAGLSIGDFRVGKIF